MSNSETKERIVKLMGLIKELEKELNAELEARKKQYEHYEYCLEKLKTLDEKESKKMEV
jgi:restriction endonuclease S subunit